MVKKYYQHLRAGCYYFRQQVGHFVATILFQFILLTSWQIKTGNFAFGTKSQLRFTIFYQKIDQCWVPDFKNNGLAGDLSHPKKLQSNAIYLGGLSRFENLRVSAKFYDLLISISGPEPQRTIFENMIFNQLKIIKEKF